MTIVVRSYGETRPRIGPDDQHDAILRDEGHGLFAVASGYPRSAAGVVAAREVLAVLYGEVERLCAAMDETTAKRASWAKLKGLISEVLDSASARVRLHATGEESGPTASVTLAMLRHGHAAVAHVGRTRAYFIRKGKIVRLTQGISDRDAASSGEPNTVAALRKEGKTAVEHAIGQENPVSVDGVSFRVKAGDRMVLVSETVTKTLRGDQIRRLSAMSPDETTLGRETLDLAGGQGADGDVSCVVLCMSDPEAQADAASRMVAEAEDLLAEPPALGAPPPTGRFAGHITPTGGNAPEPSPRPTALGAPAIRESPVTAESSLELDELEGDLPPLDPTPVPGSRLPDGLHQPRRSPSAGHSRHRMKLDGALDALRDKLGQEIASESILGGDDDDDELVPQQAFFSHGEPMASARRHRTTVDLEAEGDGERKDDLLDLDDPEGKTVVTDEAAFLAELAAAQSKGQTRKRTTADYEVEYDGKSDPDDPLASVSLFEGVPAEQRLALSDAIITYSLRTDQLLYEEGDEADEVYVLSSGRVQLTQSGRPVGSVGAGEVLGEGALLEGKYRRASVRARKQTVLNAIPIDILQAYLDEDPRLAATVYYNLANMLADKKGP